MIRFIKNLSTKNIFLVDKLSLILDSILQGFNQKRCHFCDETTYNSEAVCSPCYSDLPWNNTCCNRCSLPMNFQNTPNSAPSGLVCGECISSPPLFSLAVTCFRYEIPINRAIRMLKYNQKRYFATFFARLFVKNIQQKYLCEPLPDLLIPVPMHQKKQKIRGFNQSLLISQQLSKSLSIPTNTQILQKIKETNAQAGLDKRQRMKNLQGAFNIIKPVSGLHIALIDDVMTTRATIDLLSKLLIDSGVKRVDVWCIARTAKNRL